MTRDTYGMAMKATAMRMRGSNEVIPLFKKPVTDDGGKFSHLGIPTVHQDKNGGLIVKQESAPCDLDGCFYQKVFENGQQLIKPTFEQIRKRVQAYE